MKAETHEEIGLFEFTPRRRVGWTPYVVAALLGFAFVLGFADRADPPAARIALALGSAAFAAAILLFGQVVLTLRGRKRFSFLEHLPTHEALEEEKRQVLLALKEIEFDHAMNKIDDRDYEELKKRYEALALKVLKAIDEERARWLERATEDARAYLKEKGLSLPEESAASKPAPDREARPEAAGEAEPEQAQSEQARRTCSDCGTRNDPDARFCKACGTRLETAE